MDACSLRLSRWPHAAATRASTASPFARPPVSSRYRLATAWQPKWTRKTARDRCEAELLHETDKLTLTPISQAFSTAPSPEPGSPASLPDSASASATRRHQSAGDVHELFALPTGPTTTALERSPSLETSPMPAPATSPSTLPSPPQPDMPTEQQAGKVPLCPPAPAFSTPTYTTLFDTTLFDNTLIF